MKKLLMILICLFVYSCKEKSQTERSEKLEKVVSENFKNSVWLEKKSRVGEFGVSVELDEEWLKTILIFGYVDNQLNCNSIKSNFEEEYPQDTFRCNPVR
tara:strand:+ start:3075 stop:3374 length:300 start_codon:yes stop_codon:yes gene_type:complete